MKAEELLLTQRVAFETKIRACKDEEWRQSLAGHELGMNVDALFLYFLKRLSNLSGASAELNDKLREKCAIQVLSFFCKSHKESIQTLAVRALGNMGWNDLVEQRLLVREIVQSWKLWVDFVMKNKITQCPLMQIKQAQTIDSIEQQPNITEPLRK